MKFIAITVTILTIAACASPEMDAKRGAEICEKSGIDPGTAKFADCVGDQVAKMEQTRAEVGQAFAAGLSSYGASSSQYTATRPQTYYSSPAYRSPINCTSNAVGTYIYTNCY